MEEARQYSVVANYRSIQEIAMLSDHKELNSVYKDLIEGRTATPVTIREFLSWFGFQRRTTRNVEYINKELDKIGIRTLPSYIFIWVDTPIAFELDQKTNQDKLELDNHNNIEAVLEEISNSLGTLGMSEDLSFKIGKLKPANSAPIYVKPNASLKEAITIMLARNFSQLPVMATEREVKGVVSWASIGARLATGFSGPDVQSYMDEHQEISASASLFAAIKIITEHNYVLVRSISDRKISGIVTSNDISVQFEEISTPFLLIGDIENHLRYVIDNKLLDQDIKDACGEENLPKDFAGASDLNFGHYVRIMSNEKNWTKIGLHLDRINFVSELTDINAIRNDVMHFDPDPLTPQDLSKLRNVAKMFDTLRAMKVF